MDPPFLDLVVVVEPRAPEAAPGTLVELRWGEAAVAFPADAAPVLLIGQAVRLSIQRPSDGGEARVHAFVIQCLETDEGRRLYRFQVEHRDGPILDAIVNRRAAPRISPDPARPVRVVLTPPSGVRPVAGLLRDVSEVGLSVLFAREEEWVLAPHSWLWVELRLPSHPLVPLLLRGEVRHRRLERTAVHYGLRIDAANEGYGTARSLLRAYVEAERERQGRSRARAGESAA